MCLLTFMKKVKVPRKKEEKNVRRWTKEEKEKFAQVLADPSNDFAFF